MRRPPDATAQGEGSPDVALQVSTGTSGNQEPVHALGFPWTPREHSATFIPMTDLPSGPSDAAHARSDREIGLEALAALLEERLRVIADHEHRDRDPASHLARLREVSEAIALASEALAPDLDARLRHYLAQSSFDKALAHLKGLRP